ncbi:MAG: tetratricopeptide repeat protein, partial [Lachnospiraceae bacterium]|nr:tetratricopeptide repeat protein [Lachnospiraceae bacterium]
MDNPIRKFFSNIIKFKSKIFEGKDDYEYIDLKMEIAQNRESMKLFVIPITRHFLNEPSFARDEDLTFAIEHGIPILPLMQEADLKTEYANVCGDLQFLDKYENIINRTVIPYKKKLENFLSSVLPDDDLIFDVKHAFEAHIFMSYRKTDRSYAQELMRLIHQIDFCRDIAVWYDEFLQPNDHFNDVIRDTILKSDLFMMVVTPDLVKGKNYVVTHEYPAAREAKKPILPVQMADMDLKELQIFDKLPDVVDGHDATAMSACLLKWLQKNAKINLGANDDPEHLYLIGMAYLNGIDVEVNTNRALELITCAADAGQAKAMEQLANMYLNGNGVQRDYEAALQWQKKLTDLYKEEYKTYKGEYYGQLYLEAMLGLKNYIQETQQEEAEKICLQIYIVACELSKNFHGNLNNYNLALACDRLGDIFRDKSDLKKAWKYYIKGLRIKEKLELYKSGDLEIWDIRFDISISCDNLGSICEEEERYEQARGYYEASLEISKELADEERTEENRFFLSSSYQSLGNVCMKAGNLKEAKKYYGEALEIKKRLAEESGT